MQNYIDDINITEDNYVMVTVNNVKVENNQFSKINTDSSTFINCTKDRYDQNCFLYYSGDHITLNKFILSESFDFNSLKKLILNLTEALIKCNDKILIVSNVLVSSEYIFVDSHNGNIKLIYLPVSAGGNMSEAIRTFQNLLKEIVNTATTNNAANLLGFILSESNINNFDIEVFQKKLYSLKNKADKIKLNKGIQAYLITVLGLLISSIGFTFLGLSLKMPMIEKNFNLNTIFIFGAFLGIGALISLIICLMLNRVPRNNTDIIQSNSKVHLDEFSITNMKKNVPISESFINKSVDESFGDKEYKPNSHTGNKSTGTNVLNINQESSVEKTLTGGEIFLEAKGENGTQLLFSDSNETLAYIIKKGNTEIVDRIYISDPQFIVGRDNASSNFVIQEKSISKQHATIKFLDNNYLLVDNNSSNGTFLNSKKLQPNVDYPLNTGDVITFAKQQFQFYDK